jgi:hypothetical protein
MGAWDGSRKPSRNPRSRGTSCEQLRPGWREPDKGAALVHRQPSALDAQFHARAAHRRQPIR